MKKRFIALLLCCVMLLTLSPSLISAASADDDVADALVTDTAGEMQNQSVADVTDTEPTTDGSGDTTGSDGTDAPGTEPVIESAGESETLKECTCDPKPAEGEAHKESCPLYEESETDESAESGEADKAKVTDTSAEAAGDQPAEQPVESEIITPAVNFTNVAPFLAPVTGASRQLSTRGATTFALAKNEPTDSGDNGVVLNKTATANSDGTYTITLEAYATGEKVITETKKDVPTDIILVLDQSGSMDESMSTYAFREYTGKSNGNYYDLRHNNNGNSGNLYYQLEDGSYATVSVTRTQGESTYTYTECPSDWENDKTGSIGDRNPDDYWKYSENLYVKVGEEYQEVKLQRDWVWESILSGYYKYTYTFPDNSPFVSKRDGTSPGDFDGKGPLYYRSETAGEYTYTYTYTDADGMTQTIGSSTGANTIPTEFTLYERYSTGSVERLSALKTAVTTFTNAVAKKAAGTDGALGTADDVNHRIAVVGFANCGTNMSYENTEIFIGNNAYGYGNAAQGIYGTAFQDMSTNAGKNNVLASVDRLDANGSTYVDCGLDLANGIFGANPVPTGEKRNRVVIVFTDGAPGYNGEYSGRDYGSSGDAAAAANQALTKVSTTKNTYGATVYTVGIFSGADATSAGNDTGNATQRANWFMQTLSSNNGTPQKPSYYLSAADANSLNNIFQQISDQIETGGSGTTLGSEAVIKDIISPQFTLPEGATVANITLETYSYTGEGQWSKNLSAMDAEATIEGSQVSVTGFDFSENWCGTETNNGTTTYRGNKLVISFTVSPKAGFLGGNNVYTNADAGVYVNSNSEEPVLIFDRPQVNVPIKDVTVTAADKNVYLLGGLTAEQLKSGATVKVGDVVLDLTKSNYGLADWQTAYVNITAAVKDKDGNAVTDLTGLTEDTTYTVSVTVAPKTNGTGASGTPAAAKSNTGTDNINVFKPELTFEDSAVYYGDTAPNCTGNLTDTKWKHGDTASTTVTMIGTAPELTLTYTPEEGKIDTSNKINTKQDIAVDVAVKIGEVPGTEYATFMHQACNPACGWSETALDGSPAFLLHVNTCTLTITKTGGTNGEPYVFTVKKDGEKYTEVTIVGNNSEIICELPVGTYTIVEDTGWSWRYPNPTYTEEVVLSAVQDSGNIICTNKPENNLWLNGFSTVVKNIYDPARVEQ